MLDLHAHDVVVAPHLGDQLLEFVRDHLPLDSALLLQQLDVRPVPRRVRERGRFQLQLARFDVGDSGLHPFQAVSIGVLLVELGFGWTGVCRCGTEAGEHCDSQNAKEYTHHFPS